MRSSRVCARASRRFMPRSMPERRRRSTAGSARCWWRPASASAAPHSAGAARRQPPRRADAACDVAILGGTGFIGTHVVRRFVAEGARVAVMARSVRNLPAIFGTDAVSLHAGDLRDADAVATAIGAAPIVVNLAHGGGGARGRRCATRWWVARRLSPRRARAAADPYRFDRGIVSRAAGQPVTGATPPDPQADERADYARAKAMTDRMLLGMHGLNLCILRPGTGGRRGRHCHSIPVSAFSTTSSTASAGMRGAIRCPSFWWRTWRMRSFAPPRRRDRRALLQSGRRRSADRPRVHRCARRGAAAAAEIPSADGGSAVGAGIREVPDQARHRPQRGTTEPARSAVPRLTATFDCGDAKRDLGWSPNADPVRFRERAILVHAG